MFTQILEYLYLTFYSLCFTAASYIPICVILSFMVILVRKRKIFSGKILTTVAKIFSWNGTPMSFIYQRQSSLLKIIAQQISEDREIIKDSVLNDYYHFQDHGIKELNFIHSSTKGSLHSIMQEKYLPQNKLAEETLETLKTLENDLSALKNQLHVLFSNQKTNTQQVDFDSEVIKILTTAKEDFTKLISDNRSKEKEVFQTITRFLQQSQTDIRKEVVLFNSVAKSGETFDEENFKRNLQVALERMEKMKKNLISAQIFFNRQCLGMEKLQQTIMCFNQKVMYFAVMFDKLSKQNKRIGNNACKRLEDCNIAYTSLAEKIDTNTNSLLQQSKIFADVLSGVQKHLKKNKVNINSLALSISKIFEELPPDSTYNTEITWIGNIDILNQKLENLVHISEKGKIKEETLTRTLNNYENFHNLMKSMTRSYNTLLKYFISTLERSQKCHPSPKIRLNQKEELVKNKAETCDKSPEKIIEMKKHRVDNVSKRNEVQKELDVNVQNADIENVAFLLKDIMTSIRKLFDEGEDMKGCIYETDVAQSVDYKQWGDFPSESLLTDVSSEFLVHSSDESTGGLSEMTLEG